MGAHNQISSDKETVPISAVPEDQLAEVMGKNKNWSHKADESGWVRAHNAIRLDMLDLTMALSKVLSQVKDGHELEAWQVQSLQRVFTMFAKQVHHHHDNEEEIFFPWIATRVQLPQKLSSDHKTLVGMMSTCETLVKQLKPGKDTATIEELKVQFAAMRECMEEHLKEEEEMGLPLVRYAFNEQEEQAVTNKILKNLTMLDLAWFLRPMSAEERSQFLTHGAHMPGLVQVLLVNPAVKKLRRSHQVPLDDLKAGKQSKPARTSRFWFF